MRRTMVIVLVVVAFAVALFLGSLMGSKRVADAQKELGMVKTDLEKCQVDVAKALTQKELAQCKWDLVQAKTNAERRDFGKATESLGLAKQSFERAMAASVGRVDELKDKMQFIGVALGEIQTGLNRNDVKVIGRLTEVVNLIDLMLGE
jgi:predicted  nucleic acid-binding Zn-ribbon protein